MINHKEIDNTSRNRCTTQNKNNNDYRNKDDQKEKKQEQDRFKPVHKFQNEVSNKRKNEASDEIRDRTHIGWLSSNIRKFYLLPYS